jgi:hypothetical protein
MTRILGIILALAVTAGGPVPTAHASGRPDVHVVMLTPRCHNGRTVWRFAVRNRSDHRRVVWDEVDTSRGGEVHGFRVRPGDRVVERIPAVQRSAVTFTSQRQTLLRVVLRAPRHC